MRIAVVHNLPSGGAKRLTRDQVRELSRRGHDLVEVTPSSSNEPFAPLAPFVGRRIVLAARRPHFFDRRIRFLTPYVHAAQMLMLLRAAESTDRRMANFVDTNGFDLAFVHDCQVAMNPFVLRFLRTPSFFYCHHGYRDRFERGEGLRSWGLDARERARQIYYRPARVLIDRTLHRIQDKNIASAGTVIVNSRFSQEVVAHENGIGSYIVYPGIDQQSFRPTGTPVGDYVLSVGALIFSKGHRFVVRAVASLPPSRRPELFIAANASNSEEESFVRRLAEQLDVRLRIENVRDDRRLADLYSGARAFVYAPMQEALGMAPLEAASCGTPAVAVAEGGVRETVVDGSTGFLVERDVTAFANRLQTLLTDDELRARMGSAARDWVRSAWSWNQAVDRLEQLFDERLASESCDGGENVTPQRPIPPGGAIVAKDSS